MKFVFLFLALFQFISINGNPQNSNVPNVSDFQIPIRKNVYVVHNDSDFEEFLNLVSRDFFTEKDTILIETDLQGDGISSAYRNFKSVIDGKDHKIEGVTKTLFNINNGVIKGISLISGSISGSSDIGGFCIKNQGTILDCETHVNITASGNNTYMHIGGICAYNYGDIINCSNFGTISCTLNNWDEEVTRCGGITSYSEGSGIIYCVNYGSINTYGVYSSLTGGIVADLQNGKVIGCVNKGDVSSSIRSATLSDHVSTKYQLQYTGGILGQAQANSVINRCRNYGKVSSNFQYVGGIAGQISKTSVFNVINYGDITSVDGWGYSCAAGIVGYSHGTTDYYPFYNCINHGNIKSTAHYAVATSAGICMDLNKCYVANCTSFGSVSATVLGGTGTSSFQISDYEYEDCIIYNTSKTVEDANVYITENYNSEQPLLKWYINDEGIIDLYESFISYPVPMHGNCSVHIFPKTDEIFQIEICGDNNVGNRIFESKSPIIINNLTPSTKYKYIGKSFNSDYIETGEFITRTPNIGFTIDDIQYDRVTVSQTCNAQGVEAYSCKIIFTTSESVSFSYPIKNNTCIIEGLEEGAAYSVHLVYSLNGKLFKSDLQNITTQAISPQFSLMNATPYSLKLKCTNYELLKKYSPRLYIENLALYNYGTPIISENTSFPLNDDGVVEITGLHYDYTPEIKSEYLFNGETRHRPLDNKFTTLNWGGEGVIQVSKNAAMIHGLFGGLNEEIPESWNFGNDRHYYRNHYFVYCNASDAETETPNTLKGARIDDKVDVAVTIPIDEPFYQYHIRIQDDRKYYGKYTAKDGEWQIIDATIPNVDVVEPRFYYARFSDNTISISFIDGEETTENVFLQYKLEKLTDYNQISLQAGSGTAELSKRFTSLIPSQSYLFRFYSITKSGKKYFSKVYRLSNGILSEANDVDDDQNTAIFSLTQFSENINIMIEGRNIFLLNKKENSICKIYDLVGRLIYSGFGNTIELPCSGVYIITVGDKSIKVTI